MTSAGKTPIREDEVIVRQDTRKIPVFTAGPDDDARCPGLILIHEIFGVNEHIRDLARRFAAQSMRVYAPDLFAASPLVPSNRDDLDAMRQVWSSIPDAQFISDLKAVFKLAQANSAVAADSIGTIGYCMGGAIALMFACETPEIAAAADYYGRIFYPQLTEQKPKHPIDYVYGLNCPILGVFAGQDQLITAEHIDELSVRLQKYGKSHQIKVYEDAPHAFFNDRRPNYREAAAHDAWTLTMTFFRNNLSTAGVDLASTHGRTQGPRLQ